MGGGEEEGVATSKLVAQVQAFSGECVINKKTAQSTLVKMCNNQTISLADIRHALHFSPPGNGLE